MGDVYMMIYESECVRVCVAVNGRKKDERKREKSEKERREEKITEERENGLYKNFREREDKVRRRRNR